MTIQEFTNNCDFDLNANFVIRLCDWETADVKIVYRSWKDNEPTREIKNLVCNYMTIAQVEGLNVILFECPVDNINRFEG